MSYLTGGFKTEDKHTLRVDSTDIFAVQKLKNHLLFLLEKNYCREQQLIVLCIGTDRSTGDALGPPTGSKLKQLSPPGIRVYGTLDEPVHAVNLVETILDIKKTLPAPFIIAVDACLGRMESVGCIDLGSGPLYPGAGVSKELPLVGEIFINGIVNVSGFLEYFVLQNTRLSLVFRLAEIITRGIYYTALALRQDKKPSGSENTEAAR